MTQSGEALKVSFHQVELIELPYCLGDNTACSHGAPISVEWQAQKRTSFDVNFFEEYRPRRRSARMLLLSGNDRETLLLRHGYDIKEIHRASKTVQTVRQEDEWRTKQLHHQGPMLRISTGDVGTTSPHLPSKKQLIAHPIRSSSVRHSISRSGPPLRAVPSFDRPRPRLIRDRFSAAPSSSPMSLPARCA